MSLLSSISCLSVRITSRFHSLSFVIVAGLVAACGGESNTAVVANVDSGPNPDINGPATVLTEQSSSEVPPTEEAEQTRSEEKTGVFLDSLVSGIPYSTPSISGKTNQLGEFQYRSGEQIVFTIGTMILPSVDAKEILTPLDIFETNGQINPEAVNLSRLLLTLDADSNAENGIQLPESVENLSPDWTDLFNDTASFDNLIPDALVRIGIETRLVRYWVGATHLTNTLLAYGLTEVEDPDAVEIDEATGSRFLIDLDLDGIADIYDSDVDGDRVWNDIDLFPRDGTEQRDRDSDGIGDNADTDDDNDGVSDDSDAFPFDVQEWADVDNDGHGDNSDTDDDNDGVPDTTDIFPLDRSEQYDNDFDGIGNNSDTDDDNDGVTDAQDAFPLDASESVDSDGDGIGDNSDDEPFESAPVLIPSANSSPSPSRDVVASSYDLDLCSAPHTRFQESWTIATLQADVDNDGSTDFVELIAEEFGSVTRAIAWVRVTFGNGAVIVGDAGLIWLWPDGTSLHAADLHYEPDGMKEIIFNTHHGERRFDLQKVFTFRNCEFVLTDSEQSDRQTGVSLHDVYIEGDGFDIPYRHSSGCSWDDDHRMSIHGLGLRYGSRFSWRFETWRLFDTRWQYVGYETGSAAIAPEPLPTCLADTSENSD